MKPSLEAISGRLQKCPAILLQVCGNLGIWLGFANNFFDFPPCVFLWPVACALLGLRQQKFRMAFLQGWLCTFPGSLASLYWLYMPVSNVGGLPLPLAALCAALICACLACQGGIFALCARFLGQLPPFQLSVALALSWYLLEYGFALLLGFPWLQLSGALIAWPALLQQADILGGWLGASLWLLPVFLVIFSSKKFAVSCALLICAAIAGYGTWRLYSLPFASEPLGKDAVRAIFIEGNVDQNQKWTPEFQAHNLDLYLSLTQEALANEAVSQKPLVIWPETALPFFYERMPVFSLRLADAVATFGCPLLFGAPGVEELPGGGEAIFNRAFLLNPQGKLIGHYDKEHLVPFGEYLPDWLNLKFLEALLQGVGIYSEGQNASPLKYEALAMGILICYEGIFPWLAQERVAAGANILVDISNDGWFGHSPAAMQHLRLSLARCIEQNRWLLRATNTGISAVADNRGRVTVAGPMFVREYMAVSARLLEKPSVYCRLAMILPLLCLVALGFLVLPLIMRKRLYNASSI